MSPQSGRPASPGGWLGATCDYEGARLALRVRAEVRSWPGRGEFPCLFAVTLHLAEVRSDGLPVPSYNDSLLDLDLAMIERIERDGAALVVLIETFSGKRTWYAYGRAVASVEGVLRDIERRFPGHRLTSRAEPDAEWRLWETYRRLFEPAVEGDW